MEDGAIPATVAIPNGYVRLDPRDILKETDLVFVCQPGRAPIFRPTISAGCMAGEDMIYIRRLRAPASPPKPEGREWPFTDPKAMESIERGIADAKAGRIYGTGEGMREAGGPREALRELLTAIDPAGWATDPSVTAYKLTPRLRAACANGWAAMGEASEPVSPKGEPT